MPSTPKSDILASDEFDEGFEKVVNADLPKGMVVTAIFEDLDSKTKLTLQIMHESIEDRLVLMCWGSAQRWR